MPIIVADSGSTKTDWCILGKGEPMFFQTMGFNPFFHSEQTITDALERNHDFLEKGEDATEIFFYGAGCSSEERNRIVARALKVVFPKAKIMVDHDIKGAAIATCGNEKGITCILGTGSNACYYDGDKISQVVPALGYILGDEGSGSYYGKLLLSNFLYKLLPADLHEAFVEKYGLTKEDIFHHVHAQPYPNVYLASFAKFLGKNLEHPYVREMVAEGTRKFLNIHVTRYPDLAGTKVHFVGSIAYNFQDVVTEECEKLGITVGKFFKQPIHGLAEFYQEMAV